MRIVSLLPSATEIVHALGLTEHLVAVSHDCDWPPEVRGLPVLSEAEVDSRRPSAEIDAHVRGAVHRGRSLYHLDAERLSALEPDLILTQELCEVCAPAFTEVQAAARVLDDRVRIASLEPVTLDGILDNVRLVGRLTDRLERAEAVVAGLAERVEHVRRRGAGNGDAHRPRVLALEWLEPLFVGGHWVPEMIELAGGVPLGWAGERSRVTDWAEVEAFAPEVVVLMPCGFTPERTLEEAHVLTRAPLWTRLPAVRAGRVHVVHGSYYFSRAGPRAVTGLETLAKLVHPTRFADLELPDDALGPPLR